MTTPKIKTGTIADALLAAFFTAAVSIPPLGAALRSGPAAIPVPARHAFQSFEEDFDERLGFLDAWIRRAAPGLLPPARGGGGVLLGKDGWLFHLEPGSDPAVASEEWERLDRLTAAYRAGGGKFLFVAGPAKASVYPEKLPDRIPFWMENTVRNAPMEDFLAGDRGGSEIAVLDLKPALVAAKASGRVYRRTDIHWNGLGAFYGFRAVMTRLREWFPELAVPELSDFRMGVERSEPGNLARKLSPKNVRPEENLVLAPKSPRGIRVAGSPPGARAVEREGPGLRAVVVGDSYGRIMAPLLEGAFARTVFVDAGRDWPVSVIKSERPDIVLHIRWGRNSPFLDRR